MDIEDSPTPDIALNELGEQLSVVFRMTNKQLWRRIFLVILSVSVPAGAVGFFLQSFAGAEGVKIFVFALVAAVLTVAGMYPALHTRNAWLLETVSAISKANIDLIWVLAKLTELRDDDTKGHNIRVSLYTAMFAETLNLSPEVFVRTVKGALVHDIGKLVVDDSVLKKNGPLTVEERKEMEKHVVRGAEIVVQSQLLREAVPVVFSHHERFDGSGYPKGLNGEEIPYEARIFALADVYDALVSPRVYKEPILREEALKIMIEGCGTHFDPLLLERFVKLAPAFADIPTQDEAALVDKLARMLSPHLDRFLLGLSLAEI